MVGNLGAADVVKKVSGRVAVQTPEQIQFQFELAGMGARGLAFLIDLAIRLGIVSVVSMVIGLATSWISEGFSTGLMLLLLFVVEWGYGTILEWRFNGRTPGKAALGLRVLRTDGVSIDFIRSAMRNLLRAADMLPLFYTAGVLTMFISGTQRRLGDLAADTMVVREKKAPLKDLPPFPGAPFELPAGSLATLRLKERDLSLIDEFFRRRHLFSPERARELAEILANPAARTLGLEGVDPEGLLAGILVAGREVRASWYGRAGTAVSAGGA